MLTYEPADRLGNVLLRFKDRETKHIKVYVAGPMRGIPKFNFPAFNRTAQTLRSFGFVVINPAEEDVKHDGLDVTTHEDFNVPPHTFAYYMKRDLALICDCQAVAVLPFWQNSQGATLEVHVARSLGLVIFDAGSGKVLSDADLDTILRAKRDDTGLTTPEGLKEMHSTPVMCGIGGAPIRASILPESAADRKAYPVASGCLDYFPDALCAIAKLSHVGNEQHNPGKPLHWDRSKSGDEADTMLRHFLQRGTTDNDGVRHTTKMAWRALALLQKELEAK